MPRLVLVSGPEAGAVGCEHLIAENHIAVLIQAELEFGIRNDDAAASRVIRTFLVKRDGIIAELGRVFFAFAREIFFQMGNALLIGNVFVMIPDLGLGRRGVDRLR